LYISANSARSDRFSEKVQEATGFLRKRKKSQVFSGSVELLKHRSFGKHGVFLQWRTSRKSAIFM
jgi:hypothetical protein